MVFDNVQHDIALKDYVPKTGCGSILLTSRDPDSRYGLGISGCRVASFDNDDSAQFLFQSLPYSDLGDPLEQRAAKSLLRELGGLPLGIRQIGNFIRESGSRIQECVTLLANKAEERDILSDESGLSVVPYSSSLSKTWEASVNQLDRGSLSILSLLSFFDPDCIQSQFTKEIRQLTPRFRRFFPDTVTSVQYD
ncbi:Disease resistance protein [Ilyonectria robusta]